MTESANVPRTFSKVAVSRNLEGMQVLVGG